MQIQPNEPWPMPDDCDIAAFMEALRVSDCALHQTEMEAPGLSPVPVILCMPTPETYDTPIECADLYECLPDLGEPDDDCLWWAPDDADVTPY